MLLAYIDEIGETGAFVSHDHPKFRTSPAFGYAGFVIPAADARRFGAAFVANMRALFKTEIGDADPAQFERKGAEVFRPATLERFPQQPRVFNSLVARLQGLGGALFYYADEKPLGTPKQTGLDTDGRETAAMREALNRLARHAQKNGANILVMIDQINEKTRIERLRQMYGHILGRASGFPEADDTVLGALRGAFTHESKLHFWHRSPADLHHSQIFQRDRPVHPLPSGQLIGAGNIAILRKIKAAAERAHDRSGVGPVGR